MNIPIEKWFFNEERGMKKKVLSGLLSLCMVVAFIPSAAFAVENGEGTEDLTNEQSQTVEKEIPPPADENVNVPEEAEEAVETQAEQTVNIETEETLDLDDLGVDTRDWSYHKGDKILIGYYDGDEETAPFVTLTEGTDDEVIYC